MSASVTTLAAHRSRPRCHSCPTLLASDNPGPQCSPCRRRDLLASGSRVLPFLVKRDELLTIFEADGLAGLAERLDCGLVDAFEVAIANGLVPASYRRRMSIVRQLIDCAHLPHVTAADRLGISRWTVASYRKDLRLHRGARTGLAPLPPAA
jgi:hypothetical protein